MHRETEHTETGRARDTGGAASDRPPVADQDHADLRSSTLPEIVKVETDKSAGSGDLANDLQALAARIPELSVDPQGFCENLRINFSAKGMKGVSAALSTSPQFGPIFSNDGTGSALPLVREIELAGGLYVVGLVAAKDPLLAETLIARGFRDKNECLRIAEQLEQYIVSDMRLAILSQRVLQRQHATETDRAFVRGALQHYFALDLKCESPGFWRGLRQNLGLMYEDPCELKGSGLIGREANFLQQLKKHGANYRLNLPALPETLAPDLKAVYSACGKDQIRLIGALDTALNKDLHISDRDFFFMAYDIAGVNAGDGESAKRVMGWLNDVTGTTWSENSKFSPSSQASALPVIFKALSKVSSVAEPEQWRADIAKLTNTILANPSNAADSSFTDTVRSALETLSHRRAVRCHPEIGLHERLRELLGKWVYTEKRVSEMYDIVESLPSVSEEEFRLIADKVVGYGPLTQRACTKIAEIIESATGDNEYIYEGSEGNAIVLMGLKKLGPVRDAPALNAAIAALKESFSRDDNIDYDSALNTTLNKLSAPK